MKLKEVDIELMGVCNASCVYCTWQSRETGKQAMDTELAMSLIQQCHDMRVETVRYHHTGESLMHPDVLEILECGNQLIKQNTLSTNGSLLKGEKAERISQLKSLQLICSIHWVMGEKFVKKCAENLQAYLAGGFQNRRLFVQLVMHVDAREYCHDFVAMFLPLVEPHQHAKIFLKQPRTWPNDDPN